MLPSWREAGRELGERASGIATQELSKASWWLWETPGIPWRWLSQATPFVKRKGEGAERATSTCAPAALGSCGIPELFTILCTTAGADPPSLPFSRALCLGLSAQIYRSSQDPCAQPVPTTLGLIPRRVGTALASVES